MNNEFNRTKPSFQAIVNTEVLSENDYDSDFASPLGRLCGELTEEIFYGDKCLSDSLVDVPIKMVNIGRKKGCEIEKSMLRRKIIFQ